MNLIKGQWSNINKILWYVKDSFESKFWLLINEREKVGTEKLKNPKAFIDYSQTIDDVYENLDDYNLTKKRRVLIVFDGIIVDMESNKKLLSYCYRIVFKWKNAQYFSCFYITILFQRA